MLAAEGRASSREGSVAGDGGWRHCGRCAWMLYSLEPGVILSCCHGRMVRRRADVNAVRARSRLESEQCVAKA